MSPLSGPDRAPGRCRAGGGLAWRQGPPGRVAFLEGTSSLRGRTGFQDPPRHDADSSKSPEGRSSTSPSASAPAPAGFRARRSTGPAATFDEATEDGTPGGGEPVSFASRGAACRGVGVAGFTIPAGAAGGAKTKIT